ncbi:MAG: tRNA uridine-5-carboxymethylaminomethyl(34) synthesis GTPase MnmE [Thermodesulfovibrionales bacterium]
MFDDTIAAISTPLGEGGIGIVRISGRDAINIADRIFFSPKGKRLYRASSHTITYGFIKDPVTGEMIDEVLVSVMKAPNTYTKEDIVEINCHGGFLPLRKTLELVLREGARLSEPGEFTKRAFLNGRIDLTQAEAVADLIRSKTESSQRLALEQLKGGLSEKITKLRDRLTNLCAHIEAYIDFPDEDIEPVTLDAINTELSSIINELERLSKTYEEGRFLREGVNVAIVGKPNVGKSSLLNALLERDRAIVTEFPGTTRDVIEELLNIKGLLVRVMDTAGIREAHEMAEREGVRRSLQAIDDSDLVIVVIDGSRALSDEDMYIIEKVRERGKRFLIGINKSDLCSSSVILPQGGLTSHQAFSLNISAKTGQGLEELKDAIINLSLGGIRGDSEGLIITNLRHKRAIDDAISSLEKASLDIINSQPKEIIALSLREGLDHLGEIVGAVTTEDILNRVFSEFCIGK